MYSSRTPITELFKPNTETLLLAYFRRKVETRFYVRCKLPPKTVSPDPFSHFSVNLSSFRQCLYFLNITKDFILET